MLRLPQPIAVRGQHGTATDDVCAEWTRAAVRHIARNCEIECCWSHTETDPPTVPHDSDGDSEAQWDRYKDAEHIASWHPAVALAVADWLDDIATRHKASDYTLDLYLHYDSDGECETCEGGGHPSIVCEGCFPSYEGMDGHTVYPCAETKAALAVAAAYLGTDA